MNMGQLINALADIYSGAAYALTVISGLLTIMVERFLYKRRGYKREAFITALFGWFYIVGGTLLYVSLIILQQWV